jgi:exonuclease SbcC
MRLNRIHLDNYRRFKWADLEFPDGIVGIIGNNGAGKSTLMEAIAWALFGTDASRTSKDQIKSSFAARAEACRVILDFEMNGDSFQVVRELKGVSNSVDASVIVNKKVSARGNNAVNDLVQKTLDMDYRAFMTSFYAKQRELNALSDYQPFKRKELLARMLGIEKVDEALKRVRSDARGLELKLELSRSLLRDKEALEPQRKEKAQNLAILKEKLRVAEEKLKSEKASLAEMEASWKNLKAKQEEMIRLDSRRSVARSQRSGLEAQVKSLEEERNQLVGLEPEREDLEGRLVRYDQVKADVSRLDEQKARAEYRKATERQADELHGLLSADRARLVSLDQKLQLSGDLHSRLAEIKAAVDSLETELEQQRNLYVKAEAAFRSLEDENKRLQSQLRNIEELGPDSVCDRCLRPMGTDFHKIREHLLAERSQLQERAHSQQREREVIKKRGQDLKDRKLQLESQREKVQSSLESLSKLEGERRNLQTGIKERENSLLSLEETLKQMGEIEYDPASHNQLKEQLEHLEKLKSRWTEVTSELRRLPQLVAKSRELGVKLDSVKKEESELEKAVSSLDFSETEYRATEAGLEQKRKVAHQAELDLKETNHQSDLLQKEVDQIDAEISRAGRVEKDMAGWQDERRYLEKLDLLFSDFKVALIGRIRPTLSRHAKSLFLELSDNRYEDLELDEDYEIYIYDQGEKFPMSRFSGGETDLANLCLRIAISLLISESSQIGFSFIILDEIFGSQDMVRKENILNALAKLRNRFAQIFLITHIDDIKDSVENLVYVTENEDGTSELQLQ